MRILIVTNEMPFPGHSGGAVRVRQLVERIGRRDQVVVAAHVRSPDEREEARRWRRGGVRVIAGEVPPPRSASAALWIARRALRGEPAELGLYWSAPLAREIAALLAGERIDVLQIEQSILSPYLRLGRPGTSTVLAFHDLRYAQAAGIAALEPTVPLRAWRLSNAAWMRRHERRIAARVDRCITVTERDRQRLLKLCPSAAVDVVANGADVEGIRPLPLAAPATHPTILFVGNMAYLPCEDGAIWFVRRVLPLVRRRIAARFAIVGRDPGPRVRALAAAEVEVTGTVADVAPHYAAAAAVVVPIRAGGGSRLKILEAMAFARPIVSTSVGAEGLRVRRGRELVVADDEGSFADAVVAVLEDREHAAGLAAAARRRVEEDYGWEAAAARQLAIYDALRR